MPARLPDFLGVGTQKGGTTSMHQWLNQYPEIFMPEQKEIHYFDLNHEKKIEWYKSHFDKATYKQKCGEITPFYLFHPEVAKRIKKAMPKVKLIILLRDPVERTMSQYYHSQKRGFEELDASEAIAEEENRLKTGDIYSLQKHSYISRSKYIEQIDRYEKLFSKEQILIQKSEDMFENSSKFQNAIKKFLEIEGIEIDMKIPNLNKGRQNGSTFTRELKEKIKVELEQTVKEVRNRYGITWDWTE